MCVIDAHQHIGKALLMSTHNIIFMDKDLSTVEPVITGTGIKQSSVLKDQLLAHLAENELL